MTKIELPSNFDLNSINKGGTTSSRHKIDKNKVLNNLKLFSAYAETKVISSKDFDKWDKKYVSSSRISKEFGTWWDACRQAELYAPKIPKQLITPKFLVSHLIEAITSKVVNPKKSNPTSQLIKKHSKLSKTPLSYRHYNTHFGSITDCWKLIEESFDINNPTILTLKINGDYIIKLPENFNPKDYQSNFWQQVSDEEMLKGLAAYGQKVNKPNFTQREFDKWDNKPCFANRISIRFGSWATALEKAGLTVSTIYKEKISLPDLINHMIGAVSDSEINPEKKRPNREILKKYGEKVRVLYTHYHYEYFFESIAKCWDLILKFNNGEITEEVLLSAKFRSQKKGTIYLIKVGDHYTIGKTERTIESRLKEYKTHSPDPTVIIDKKVSDIDLWELYLHTKYKNKRLDEREWFSLEQKDIDELEEVIKRGTTSAPHQQEMKFKKHFQKNTR